MCVCVFFLASSSKGNYHTNGCVYESTFSLFPRTCALPAALREKVGWLLSSQGVAAFYGIGMSPTLLGIAILVRNADHFT